ncbi:hypothetical protein QZH41_007829 [Actinostola sp. cb2023]|nr:hypothetical protein QZH41_007829 [Actinostola sp. cb2023]
MSISTDVANSVCDRFDQEGVVCPPGLRGTLFTTGALDNIDHNPSATTAKDSFHGTAISLAQHPTINSHGFHRGTNVIMETTVRANAVKELPESYQNVPPAVLKTKDPVVPKFIGPAMPPNVDHNPAFVSKEIEWFNNVKSLCGKDQLSNDEFISWAAFHASLQSEPTHPADIVALLPLFLENAHSVAMIRHAMRIESRDWHMAKRLDDVTERLEMMESFRAPGTRRSNVTFVDIPSDEHLEAPEEDELMRALDEIETRARPRTVDPGPGRPKVRPTTFDGHSSWEDYLAQFNLVTE